MGGWIVCGWLPDRNGWGTLTLRGRNLPAGCPVGVTIAPAGRLSYCGDAAATSGGVGVSEMIVGYEDARIQSLSSAGQEQTLSAAQGFAPGPRRHGGRRRAFWPAASGPESPLRAGMPDLPATAGCTRGMEAAVPARGGWLLPASRRGRTAGRLSGGVTRASPAADNRSYVCGRSPLNCSPHAT